MGSKNFAGKDSFQRMNFLVQASALVKNEVLSSYYGSIMKQIAKKSVIKIDPAVKRKFCKRCSIHQNPENSVIAEEKREEFFTIKCLKCGYKKRYPTKNYKLWLEKEESNVQDVQEKPQKAPFVQKVGQGKNKKSKKKHDKKDGKFEEMEVEQQTLANPEILKKEQN